VVGSERGVLWAWWVVSVVGNKREGYGRGG